jgi:hypothetical protein
LCFTEAREYEHSRERRPESVSSPVAHVRISSN